ncbi:hypothetical protein BOTBODRAFT_38868 [Botryobasidium botryosum FD-172 SS1]|uniref:Rab-GAP TBC domain-containing protein n=1 Tax=Botryobasidium botryosum (strain FD-172 SS1) TaxID=930990 RepID=A0A067M682_BOTB1|nr:hypothetical protein BOTBODRAFT_38868 [Botryobasidium botryosum FD-172 SS1]
MDTNIETPVAVLLPPSSSPHPSSTDLEYDSEERKHAVLGAVEDKYWDRLRDISLLPYGFGEARKEAWMFLLNVQETATAAPSPLDTELRQRRPSTAPEVPVESENETDTSREGTSDEVPEKPAIVAHPDERQVGLDTDRSFVVYPIESESEKLRRQGELNTLIVDVLRKRPQLQYFQGYHDIVSVLYLTFSPSNSTPISFETLTVLERCVEKLSLHRLRDSMGMGLEPVVGLLQVMKRVLRSVDPAFASLVEETSPLPYFALSHILTLFAHDTPTLELIQPIFDFLLCRPPIVVAYLAVAMTLSRKEEAFRLAREGDEGMMHSLLATLPQMVVAEEVIAEPDAEPDTKEAPGTPELLAVKGEQAEPSPSTEETLDSSTLSPSLLPSAPIPLCTLLQKASALYAAHPPTSPEISAQRILGPKSVVFTWSDFASLLPSDDDAEAMVNLPKEEIVLPLMDEDEEAERDDKEWSIVEKEKERASIRRQRVLTKFRGRTVMTSVVMLVGVALAIYASGGGPPGSGGAKSRDAEWRRWAAWFSGVVLTPVLGKEKIGGWLGL